MINEILKESQKNLLNIKELLKQKTQKELIIFAYYYLYETLPKNSSLKELKKKILEKLLELDNEEFLNLAYLFILKREMDNTGKKHFLKKLQYQLKEEILDEISSSKEAKLKKGIVFKLNKIKKIYFKLLPKEYKITLNKQNNLIKSLQQQLNELNNFNEQTNAQIKSLQQQLNEINKFNEQTNTQIKSLQQQLNELTFSPEFKDTFLEECTFLQHAQNECKRLFNEECKDYYILFENIFYNSEAVKNLQKIYLPYIKKEKIVDIGCGRGEFLEILRNNNYEAIGVEINPELVKHLSKKGFKVVNKDANNFLKEHKGFDTIVALEVIEHMETDYLKEFLKLSFLALNKNGIIILETLNPLSNAGLGNFYMDITHKRPLPAKMMAFWLEFIGFKNIKILYSSLVPKEYRTSFIEKNYQVYAVIGEKK